MLIENLIEILETINEPQAVISLHQAEGEYLSNLCIEDGAIYLEKDVVPNFRTYQLLDTLEMLNPDYRVYLDKKEVLFATPIVHSEKYGNTICLKCDSDDIRTEFEAKFVKTIDKMDLYLDLWKTGIDANMIRKHMGDECADRMIEFCKTHNLPAFIEH